MSSESSELNKPSQALIEDVEKFTTSALKHVEVAEKARLPSTEDIETEKKHISLVTGVETFDKNKLKPTVTQEKIVLPDKEGLKLSLVFKSHIIHKLDLFTFICKVIETEKKSKLESEI